MKTLKSFIIIIAAVSAMSCNSNNTNEVKNSSSTQGKAESIEKSKTVGELMENISQNVDKNVVVTGFVAHVCKHGGERLHLASDSSNQKIRVESGNNISHFENSLKGSDIAIKGKVKQKIIDSAYLSKREKELKSQEAGHNHENSEHGGTNTKNMVHAVNSSGQVQALREQLKQEEDSTIEIYWITARSFAKEE